MDPRSLTVSFLLPLLAISAKGPPASSPSPAPSPSTVSPPPPARTPSQYHPPPGFNRSKHPPPPAHTPSQYPPPPGLVQPQFASPNQLNVGKKVGLAFLSVVLVLQLALGGFLISKRLQLRNMALVGRRIETPSPAGSP